jgi:hypothetical protein
MSMKTSTLKFLLIKMALILIVAQTSAQDLTGTRIDVQGARFSDQLWLFTVPTCTYNFDNGWDGYKMIGSSSAPQLFAIEPDGTYQVDAVPNVNNRYLGFSAGIDTAYTFTFVHENLSVYYTQLYLIDSVANKTTDIFASGTTYTFSALPTTEPVRRFKIVTSLPPVVITPVPKDTIPVVIPPTVPPEPTDSTGPKIKDCKGKKDKNCPLKKLKIYGSDKYVYIENPFKFKGKMKICHAVTGKVLKSSDFNADGTTIITANIPRGIYIVTGTTQSDNVTALVIIH